MHLNSSIHTLSKLKLEIVEKTLRVWFLQKTTEKKGLYGHLQISIPRAMTWVPHVEVVQ